MNELMNDPGVRLYAVCAAILVVKMWLTGNATGLLRVLRKSYSTPEDFAMMGLSPGSPDVQIDRIHRAHRNDLENILPFLVVAFLYVLTGPSYSVAWWLFTSFTAARVLHTIVYALGLQPWRTIVFEVGNVALLVTTVLLLVNLSG